MPPILFAVETAESRSLPLSAQRLVNAFVEVQTPDAKAQTPLFGVPGLTRLGYLPALGTGPVRGAWDFRGTAYFVSGTDLHRMLKTGAHIVVGTGILGNGLVSMADNGTQMCIVNGTSGWIYTLAGGLVKISSPAFYPARTVIFIDGYFAFERAGTNEWFLSALFDGLTYDASDFASAEAEPGVMTALVQNGELVFLFCVGHIELWFNSGGAGFPFSRYSGGVVNYGCISPYAICKQDGAIFFLGADKMFYRLQANDVVRISTHAIETVIDAEPDISTAQCMTFSTQGHKFVILTLTGTNRTLVFDISTSKWHERESWDPDNQSLGRWRGNVALEIYQRVLIGDAFDGRVSYVDWSNATEMGNTIRLLVHSAPLHQQRKFLFFSALEIDVQAGVGLTLGQGSDPQVMLQISRDGGQTWGSLQVWRSLGKIGETGRRLRWTLLGRARTWVFRLVITDPVIRVLIQAHGEYAVGM